MYGYPNLEGGMMKNVKLGIAICGVLGLLSCFIGDTSLWKLHEVPGFMAPVLLAMVGFAAAAAMGAMSISKPPMMKWQAIVALVGSIASLWIWQKVGVVGEVLKLAPLTKDHSVGSILSRSSAASTAARVVSIIALVKTDEAK